MICSLDEDTHANIRYIEVRGCRSGTPCKFRFTYSTTIWTSPVQYVIPLTTLINTSPYIMWKFVVHLPWATKVSCRIYREKKTRTSSINGTKIVLASKDKTRLYLDTPCMRTLLYRSCLWFKTHLKMDFHCRYARIFYACKRYSWASFNFHV